MATDTLSLVSDRNKRFYVYLYRDPRPERHGELIYVGKGTAAYKRADHHWRRVSHNPIFAAILEKIRTCGLSPIIEIVAWFDIEAEAFDLERFLIAKFGRRDLKFGPLANMTDGGDGAIGHIPSVRAREASRARLKKIRAAQWDDPLFRANSLKNLDICRKAMWSDASRRAQTVVSIRAAKAALAADPERSARQSKQRSELRKSAWKSPQIRERYITSLHKTKEARSSAMKVKWADPEYRAKRSENVGAATRAAWADRS